MKVDLSVHAGTRTQHDKQRTLGTRYFFYHSISRLLRQQEPSPLMSYGYLKSTNCPMAANSKDRTYHFLPGTTVELDTLGSTPLTIYLTFLIAVAFGLFMALPAFLLCSGEIQVWQPVTCLKGIGGWYSRALATPQAYTRFQVPGSSSSLETPCKGMFLVLPNQSPSRPAGGWSLPSAPRSATREQEVIVTSPKTKCLLVWPIAILPLFVTLVLLSSHDFSPLTSLRAQGSFTKRMSNCCIFRRKR